MCVRACFYIVHYTKIVRMRVNIIFSHEIDKSLLTLICIENASHSSSPLYRWCHAYTHTGRHISNSNSNVIRKCKQLAMGLVELCNVRSLEFFFIDSFRSPHYCRLATVNPSPSGVRRSPLFFLVSETANFIDFLPFN